MNVIGLFLMSADVPGVGVFLDFVTQQCLALFVYCKCLSTKKNVTGRIRPVCTFTDITS